jgi:flagellar assembly protein FliH
MAVGETQGAGRITTYAFQQLDSPAQGQLGGVADVLSAAWAEAEQVRAQARLAGEAEGRAEGLAAAQAEAGPALEALGAAVRSFELLRADLVTALEREAADLAIRISEQIVAGAIEVQPERIVDIARGALRRLADRHRVTILVNPGDLELLGESLERLQAELGGIEHLEAHADRRIERGGAIVRTDSGEIDTTIAAQLQSAREIIRDAMRGDGADAEDSGDGSASDGGRDGAR